MAGETGGLAARRAHSTMLVMHSDSEITGAFPPHLTPQMQSHLENLRLWTGGALPAESFAACAAAWPDIREVFLEQWRRDLADPTRDAQVGALPMVGLHLAAANGDAPFLDVLLLGLHMNDDDMTLLFGELYFDGVSALMGLMARGGGDAIQKLEMAARPQPALGPAINSVPMESLGLMAQNGYYEKDRLEGLIREIDAELKDDQFAKDRRERRQWIASLLMDLGPGGLLDLLGSWSEAEPVAEVDGERVAIDIITFDVVEASAGMDPSERAGKWHALKTWKSVLSDPYEALDWMTEDFEDDEDDWDGVLPFDGEPSSGGHGYYQELGMPIVRVEPKIGRNDPCPCGSGKKYKKCCGKN